MSDAKPRLSELEQKLLLQIARDSVAAAARGSRPSRFPGENDGPLARPAACFVTLRIAGELRGCIGTLEADRPLAEATREMARAAALRDPRFTPLGEDEVERVRIGISVLGACERVSADLVHVGRHGLAIRRGEARGVLLPQVAIERGWDRETFLAHTCRKAGLDPDAWRDPDTVIEVFGSLSVEESSA